MKPALLMAVCSLMIAPATWAGELPRFGDYPVNVMQPVTQHAPRLVDTPIRTAPFSPDFHPPFTRYKKYLSFAMDDSIKPFAGHYRISEWGCGTGCRQSAIVDNLNGHVYGYFQTDAGLDFRPDSRLLIVNPGLDAAVADGYSSGQHTSYWVWNGHGFDAVKQKEQH